MKMDIDDLNYLTSHEDLNPPFLKEAYKFEPIRILRRWFFIISKGIRSIPSFLDSTYFNNLKTCDILFLPISLNNKRVLEPICEKMKGSRAMLIDRSEIPIKRADFYAMLYSPVLLIKIIFGKGYLKKAYASEFVRYCIAYGYYIAAKDILVKISPRFIIFSNDHSAFPRAFFRMAQVLKIKTVYAQHASVTSYFPPLDYDYSFLDGMETYEKYISGNKVCRSSVFLSGSPRFDVISGCNNKLYPMKKIGIALNAADDLGQVEKLVNLIKSYNVKIVITIRPHPSINKDEISKLAINLGCDYSDSTQENPFVFIEKNTIFIGGESSIHLDIALMGKKSFYFNFTEKPILDWYGYLKNGLIREFTTDCLDFEDINIDKNLLQYYVANFKQKSWGNTAKCIADALTKLLDDGMVSSDWTQLQSSPAIYK